jgi:hypothetical protein
VGAAGGPAGLPARSGPDRVRVAVEVGDWHRFTGATIGAFLGLVPSQHSSGAQRVQGPITRTGNRHAPPAAGRGGLASSQALSAQPGAATLPDRPAGRGQGAGRGGATAACTNTGADWTPAASARPSAPWPSPASLPDCAGAWPCWRPEQAHRAGRWGGAGPAQSGRVAGRAQNVWRRRVTSTWRGKPEGTGSPRSPPVLLAGCRLPAACGRSGRVVAGASGGRARPVGGTGRDVILEPVAGPAGGQRCR